jgi:hypothetical protein
MSIAGEVPMERTQDIGEHKGDVIGQGFGEAGGQGRKCIVGSDSDAEIRGFGEYENGGDGADVLLDLCRNTPAWSSSC